MIINSLCRPDAARITRMRAAPIVPPATRPRGVTPVSKYQLSHLSDGSLLSGLKTAVARDRETTAELLAHIAEVDQRKLYLPAAYPSMHTYCVEELHLCGQAAFKRILAARMARRFPAIFDAVAQGHLHLSAIVLLAPHLTEDTANELLAAATHKSKADIERILAERFPRPDLLAWVQPSSRPCSEPSGESGASMTDQLAPSMKTGCQR